MRFFLRVRAKVLKTTSQAPDHLLSRSLRCVRSPTILPLLIHVAGFDTIGPAAIRPLQFSYWVGVKEALEAIGVEVLIARVPASASASRPFYSGHATFLTRPHSQASRSAQRFCANSSNRPSLVAKSTSSATQWFAPPSLSPLSANFLLGRTRRPLPHLSPQADDVQSQVSHHHRDPSPRFLLRRLSPRRPHRPFPTPRSPRAHVERRSSGRGEGVR